MPEEDDNTVKSLQPNKAKYWRLVRICLTEVYGVSPRLASKLVTALRSRLAETDACDRNDHASQIDTYHAAPVNVAADLAGNDRPLNAEGWKLWLEILDRENQSYRTNPKLGQTFLGKLDQVKGTEDYRESALLQVAS